MTDKKSEYAIYCNGEFHCPLFVDDVKRIADEGGLTKEDWPLFICGLVHKLAAHNCEIRKVEG